MYTNSQIATLISLANIGQHICYTPKGSTLINGS